MNENICQLEANRKRNNFSVIEHTKVQTIFQRCVKNDKQF